MFTSFALFMNTRSLLTYENYPNKVLNTCQLSSKVKSCLTSVNTCQIFSGKIWVRKLLYRAEYYLEAYLKRYLKCQGYFENCHKEESEKITLGYLISIIDMRNLSCKK